MTATLFEPDGGTSKPPPFAFRDDDPMKPPGQVWPSLHGEYRKIVRRLLKERPGETAESIRAEAVEILKNRQA